MKNNNKCAYPIINLVKTGMNIHKLMCENNLIAKDVQSFLNLESVQAVYKWTWGSSIPTIDNLVALSSLFKVPIDQIIVVDYI